MAKAKVSTKRLQISKANSQMVIATGIAAFIVAFSIVACRALLAKRSYQAKVIGAKEKAVDQLEANIQAANELVTSYKAFVETSSNVIGGNPTGTGDRDGDNAKIILDALPSQYDFPGLASSLEKVIQNNGIKIDSINGTDDEVAQQNQEVDKPQPVEVPFTVSVSTNLDGANNLLTVFQRSIRPIKVQKIEATGNNSDLKMTVTAVTYYQPASGITINKEVIK